VAREMPGAAAGSKPFPEQFTPATKKPAGAARGLREGLCEKIRPAS
jgi:hypothetical protein